MSAQDSTVAREPLTVEEAAYRLPVCEGLLRSLDGDRLTRSRGMDAAERFLSGGRYRGARNQDAVQAMRARLDEAVAEARALVEAAPAAKGRAGKPAAKVRAAAIPGPAGPAGADFEGKHPRGGGGKWIGKGDGMPGKDGKGQPDPVVRQLQDRLRELGFHVGSDGQYGMLTEEAVKAFQRRYGLSETGKIDGSTVETLRNPPPKTAQAARAEIAAQTVGKKKRTGQQAAARRQARETGNLSADTLALKHAAEEDEMGTITEAAPFTERLHPRSREGRFAAKLGRLKVGEKLHLQYTGSTITRTDKGFHYDTHTSLGGPTFQTPAEAAGHALHHEDRMQRLDTGPELPFGVSTKSGSSLRVMPMPEGEHPDPAMKWIVVGRHGGVHHKIPFETKGQAQGYVEDVKKKGARKMKVLTEASYSSGGFATNTPVPHEYGGVGGIEIKVTGKLIGGQAEARGPSLLADPKDRTPGMDAFFGEEPVQMPPNLRESKPETYERCSTCVHHNGKRLCALYSAGTDRDDLCDSWYTLTPAPQQTAALEYIDVLGELNEAQQAGKGTAAAALAARVGRAHELLEAKVEDTPEFATMVKKFTKRGMPEAAARKAAAKALAAKRVAEAESGVPGYGLVELYAAERFDRAEEILDGAGSALDTWLLDEAKLTAAKRKKLPKKSFAIPESESYPIHDEAHARNALARVSQHGSPEEKKRVRAAVKRKYPGIVQEALDLVEARRQALWLSTTAGLALAGAEKLAAVPGVELLVPMLDEAADSMAKASKHERVGKPGGPGLWKHKHWQLPAYIQHIANDIREKRGMSTGHAIAIAVAAVKRWAAGVGNVDPGTRAAARKALAEWEALKARAKGSRGAKAGKALAEAAVAEQPDVLAEILLIEAAAPGLIHFDPHLHPRNREGRFREVLGMLAKASRGAEVTLPHGISVQTRRGGKLQVKQGGRRLGTYQKPYGAATKALETFEKHDASAARREPHYGIRGGRFNVAAVALDPGETERYKDGRARPGTASWHDDKARSAEDSAARAANEAAKLRALGNEAHARDYDEMAASFRTSAETSRLQARHKRAHSAVTGEKADRPATGIDRVFGNRVGGGGTEGEIRAGDRVTIRTPQGQERSGRAVMRGPHGWVLNMGGAHGTPGIAHEGNIVKVKGKRVEPGEKADPGARKFEVRGVSNYRQQGFAVFDTGTGEQMGTARKFMSTAEGLADSLNAEPPDSAHRQLLVNQGRSAPRFGLTGEKADPGYYDKQLDRQVGYRDALAGKPSASTQHGYRQGYSRGLMEKLRTDNPETGPAMFPDRTPPSVAATMRGEKADPGTSTARRIVLTPSGGPSYTGGGEVDVTREDPTAWHGFPSDWTATQRKSGPLTYPKYAWQEYDTEHPALNDYGMALARQMGAQTARMTSKGGRAIVTLRREGGGESEHDVGSYKNTGIGSPTFVPDKPIPRFPAVRPDGGGDPKLRAMSDEQLKARLAKIDQADKASMAAFRKRREGGGGPAPADDTRAWLNLLGEKRTLTNEQERRQMQSLPSPTEHVTQLQLLRIGSTGAIKGVDVKRLSNDEFEVFERDRNSYSQTYGKFRGSAPDVSRWIERQRQQDIASTQASASREGRPHGADFKGRASLVELIGQIPAEWAVEHGYADRAEAPVRTWRGYGGQHSTGDMAQTLRWKPNLDEERVLYHFLYGKKAPANFAEGTPGAAQFKFKKGKNKAETAKLVRQLALVQAALEHGDLAGWAEALQEAVELRLGLGLDLYDERRLLREVAGEIASGMPRLTSDPDLRAMLRADTVVSARLPTAVFLAEHGAAIPVGLRDELREMLLDVTSKDETERRLEEAKTAGDAGKRRLYETLLAAVG